MSHYSKKEVWAIEYSVNGQHFVEVFESTHSDAMARLISLEYDYGVMGNLRAPMDGEQINTSI